MVTSDSTKMLSFGLQEESGVSTTVRAFKDRVLGAAVISMQKSRSHQQKGFFQVGAWHSWSNEVRGEKGKQGCIPPLIAVRLALQQKCNAPGKRGTQWDRSVWSFILCVSIGKVYRTVWAGCIQTEYDESKESRAEEKSEKQTFLFGINTHLCLWAPGSLWNSFHLPRPAFLSVEC